MKNEEWKLRYDKAVCILGVAETLTPFRITTDNSAWSTHGQLGKLAGNQ